MSIARVLDQSETDFCRINEGPINLSISINTFPHDQIFTKRMTHTTLFMAARDTIKIGPIQAFSIDEMGFANSLP